MADDVTVKDAADVTKILAADEIANVLYPRSKFVFGPDGTAIDVEDATGKRLPVKVGDPLPAGAAIIGQVSIDQTIPGTTNLVAIGALPVGAAVIGKMGIDQTTPGTTNLVQVGGALPAGSAIVGKVGIDQTTPGTTNRVSTGLDAAIGTTTDAAVLGTAGSLIAQLRGLYQGIAVLGNAADITRTPIIFASASAVPGAWVEFGRAPARIMLALYGTSGALLCSGTVEFTDDPNQKEFDTRSFSLAGTGVGTTYGTSLAADTVTIAVDHAYRYWRVNPASFSGTGTALYGHISGGGSPVIPEVLADTARTVLLANGTTDTAGAWVDFGKAPAKIMLALYGTSGTVTADGFIEFTDDPNKLEVDSVMTYSMSGTGVGTTRGTSIPANVVTKAVNSAWRFWRIRPVTTTGISGTGAALDAYISK